MASTQGPSDPATKTLRRRTRAKSTSMSKRAPTADTVRVDRATRPSTASRNSATTARRGQSDGRDGRVKASATRAATPPTSAERGGSPGRRGPAPGTRAEHGPRQQDHRAEGVGEPGGQADQAQPDRAGDGGKDCEVGDQPGQRTR